MTTTTFKQALKETRESISKDIYVPKKALNLEEYIPFGEEWKEHMMGLTKKQLIEILKKQCLQVKKLEEIIKLRKE